MRRHVPCSAGRHSTIAYRILLSAARARKGFHGVRGAGTAVRAKVPGRGRQMKYRVYNATESATSARPANEITRPNGDAPVRSCGRYPQGDDDDVVQLSGRPYGSISICAGFDCVHSQHAMLKGGPDVIGFSHPALVQWCACCCASVSCARSFLISSS